ncbi:MAG TPA: hypothetical protein DCZ69_04670, partial [Syntrophobacteraceae bacterium]|nr:hypothetical protein [Syntrophobacteraceae bacterium]
EIQVGKLADLAVVELKAAHLRPFQTETLLNTLVFCGKAGDVRDTIIHGEVVMRNHRTTKVDEDALLEEIETSANELFAIRNEQPYV